MLYPRVLVSSLNPAWSLTIYNASSSPYTLQVMTIIALIFLPFVLATRPGLLGVPQAGFAKGGRPALLYQCSFTA